DKTSDSRGDLPKFDSLRALLDPRLNGRFRMRRMTREGPEGLVLSEIRARLRVDLDAVLVASDKLGTLLPSGAPFDELLRELPAGGVTLAPVRAVVLAQKAGLPVDYARPREGFVGLTLAAAVTRGSSATSAAVVDTKLDATLLADLCRALELEPSGDIDHADARGGRADAT